MQQKPWQGGVKIKNNPVFSQFRSSQNYFGSEYFVPPLISHTRIMSGIPAQILLTKSITRSHTKQILILTTNRSNPSSGTCLEGEPVLSFTAVHHEDVYQTGRLFIVKSLTVAITGVIILGTRRQCQHDVNQQYLSCLECCKSLWSLQKYFSLEHLATVYHYK